MLVCINIYYIPYVFLNMRMYTMSMRVSDEYVSCK